MSTTETTQAKSWMKPDQVKRVRSVCLSETFPTYLQQRNYAMITVLADTGLRVSELVDLDVGDLHLDAERPHIYLPSHKQKGRPGDATVYLDDFGDVYSARDTLKQYLTGRWKEPENGALFPSRESDRATPRSVQRVVKRAAQAADVTPQVKSVATEDSEPSPEDVTPHTFRHSVAYRIIVEQGGRLEDVQRHLRH
ncbi:site-specific recombinase XerD, partial [Halogeometricum borinquense DSM 11551]